MTKIEATGKVNLVLVSGKAFAGKTLVSRLLSNKMKKLHGTLVFPVLSFASPIKDIAITAFDWDGKKDEKGRKLLQRIGTDVGREYNPNIWKEKLEMEIFYGDGRGYPADFVFVDDWRFPDESEFFESNPLYDITRIRVFRDITEIDGSAGDHVSENALEDVKEENLVYNPDSYYNLVISNLGTIDELREKLDLVVPYLETKIISQGD